jgi:hypothetical protein
MLLLRSIAFLSIALTWTISSANAAIICNLYEGNGFCLIQYSGSVDTSTLASFISSSTSQSQGFGSLQGSFRVGTTVGLYTTGSLPNPGTPLGNGGFVPLLTVKPGSTTIGLDFVGKTLSLPVGYVSGTPIDGEATIGGSLAYLGMSGGTYSYSWSGGSESITLNVYPVPEPSSMAVFAFGSAIAGYKIRRRKSLKA